MMELATGVVFLMSSLYGAGSANGQMVINATSTDASGTAAAQASTFTSPTAIESYVRSQFADVPILVDVARCESTFRQFNPDGTVVRGRVDKDDIGVMQINERYQGPTAKKLGYDIYTVEGNVAYAKHLYEQEGIQPWSSSKPCWSDSQVFATRDN